MNEYLEAVYKDAAPRLAGRAVTLILEAPPGAFVKGQASQDQAGQLTIWLDPALGAEESYRVFLHECAHGRLMKPDQPTGKMLTDGKVRIHPGWLERLSPGLRAEQEKKAQEIASEWERVAGTGSITARLQKLLDLSGW
ncbi:MAG: hypothetical protein M1281_04740 [Chloroflexi bacterium]|nr:hypothetical protein [Chloroflexota bacterium]